MSSKLSKAAFILTGLCAAAAIAQPPAPQEPPRDRLFVVENVPALPALGATIDIIGSQGGVPGPVVTGKPYSARSITESTQTLADGNRITQRNEAAIYRDSEGRTRREQTLGGIGVWQAGEPVTMINIHDPVADKTYVLDPAARTARELRPFRMAFAWDEAIANAAADAGAEGNGEPRPVFTPGIPVPPPGVTRNVTVLQQGDGAAGVGVFGAQTSVAFAAAPPNATGSFGSEDLGEQVLEGLLVRGTKTTHTISAGAIGNERPIEIVTERWHSPDIDAVVLQRFIDPRVGETTYRLVNVARGEPSPDLFQVPQGYEIVASDAPRAGVRVGSGGGAPVNELRLRRLEPAPPQ